MSAILEWSAPMTLTTPEGTVLFNQTMMDGTRWVLIPDECEASQDVAAVKQKISGGDGDILSHRSKSGYVARISAYPIKDGALAIGADLVSMWDTLLLNLDALFNPSLGDLVSQCRLQWTPSGSMVDWMLDRARLLERPNATGLYPKKATFALDTEYPYVLRADQFTTSLTSGMAATLSHTDGTTATFPTFRIDGPLTMFTIVNADALDVNGNPIQIVYDDSLPGPPPAVGSGDYVEISCFRETVVLNGDENFGSIAGIDIPVSDLRLPIVPGDNHITLTGADGEVLWNSARA